MSIQVEFEELHDTKITILRQKIISFPILVDLTDSVFFASKTPLKHISSCKLLCKSEHLFSNSMVSLSNFCKLKFNSFTFSNSSENIAILYAHYYQKQFASSLSIFYLITKH